MIVYHRALQLTTKNESHCTVQHHMPFYIVSTVQYDTELYDICIMNIFIVNTVHLEECWMQYVV